LLGKETNLRFFMDIPGREAEYKGSQIGRFLGETVGYTRLPYKVLG
jgi:hypothetical protein